MRMRRRVPFEGLEYQFGVSKATASNYYYECLKIFHEDVAPRLLYPMNGPDIDAMTPADFAADLPGCKVIFDLTGFEKKGKENVLLSRILYSAYHHKSELGALFGKYSRRFHLSFTSQNARTGVTPSGLFVFRSKLFGGISNEVSVMFNESNILDMFKCM